MKKKSLLLTWTRWTAAGIANLTMAISPLAMGKAQEARASALADFQKAYKEVGLGSGATVGEVWEKMRGHVSGDVQAMMDPIFRGQKVKFPKVDVVPFKDKDGSEKLRILVQGFEPNKAPMTITFWDKDDKYIQFNDKIAKRSDAASLVQLSKALGVGDIEKLSQAFAQARGQMKGAGAANARQVASVQSSGKPAVAVKVASKANVFKSAAEIAKMDINKQLTYMVGMRRLYDAMEAVQRLAVKDPNYAKTKIIIPSSVPEEPQFTYVDWLLSVTRAEAADDAKDTTCVNGGWIGVMSADRVKCSMTKKSTIYKDYEELLKKCNGKTKFATGKEQFRPCNPALFGYSSSNEVFCVNQGMAKENWSDFSEACTTKSSTQGLKNCSASQFMGQKRVVSKLGDACLSSVDQIIRSWMARDSKCKDVAETAKVEINKAGKVVVSGIAQKSKCSVRELEQYKQMEIPYSNLAKYCYKLDQKIEANSAAMAGPAASGSGTSTKDAKKKCDKNPNYLNDVGTLGNNPCNQINACEALQGRFFEIADDEPQKPDVKCEEKDGKVKTANNGCDCRAEFNKVDDAKNVDGFICNAKCPDDCVCSIPGKCDITGGGNKETQCMIKSTGNSWNSVFSIFGGGAAEQIGNNFYTKTDAKRCEQQGSDHWGATCNWAADRNNPFKAAQYVNVDQNGTESGSPNMAGDYQYTPLTCLLGFGVIAMLVTCLRQRITTHKGFCGKAKPENNDIVTDTGGEGGTGTTNPNLPAPAVVGGQQ